MVREFDFRSLPFYWLITTIIIAAAVGAFAYLIASRRLKQPFVVFLARFLISFSVLLLLESLILALSPSLESALRNFTASLIGGLLGLVGVDHSVSGSIILMQNPSLAFDITVACLGGELFCTYTALVLAETAASNRQRLVGILIGLAILLGFNLFRITFSIFVERHTGFHVHDLFYVFNMIVVLLVWAGWLWTRRTRIAEPAKSAT